jgi:hypothetical protein
MNCDSVVSVRNPLQSSLVKIDGMNRTSGSQQLRKRPCESSAAATKITPGLRSSPFNKGRTNEPGSLIYLHFSTVL